MSVILVVWGSMRRVFRNGDNLELASCHHGCRELAGYPGR